jgi:hypothetical protein
MRSNPVPLADQVMTQVELPPYRGPRSPLDLVAIEIMDAYLKHFNEYLRLLLPMPRPLTTINL